MISFREVLPPTDNQQLMTQIYYLSSGNSLYIRNKSIKIRLEHLDGAALVGNSPQIIAKLLKIYGCGDSLFYLFKLSTLGRM